ncbi:MAG: hypothetical protein JWP63_6042 [Candidatus Solibacter sp.]|nr:hypothetical protein [Candidatus Solibacter sp.]
MREWLRETHGPGFELTRHFLLRFFESDLVTAPGQVTGALVSAFSVLLPWFPMIVGPLRKKYAYFSSLPTPGPYREALRADELWLITLVMAAIGLFTAIQWQSLFPGLRDYRVLGCMPLRARQIFGAKLTALVLVATAVMLTLNLLPSVLFPAVSGGHWAMSASAGERFAAHAGASFADGYFCLFALVALQGVLLNLLPPRKFGRVTGYLQGALAAGMLILIVLSFSIQEKAANAIFQSQWARWLPPAWFVGLHQTMSGDPDPAMQMLARRALAGLAIAILVALASYAISYRRHRTLLVEGSTPGRRQWVWTGTLFDRLMPDARQQAITVFLTKTLAGSSQHRTILMAYGGFGVAILLSGLIGMRELVKPDRVVAARFVYAHVILLVFLLIGVRHLFSLPVELKANWAFQITEGEGRRRWLNAVDNFVLYSGAVVMVAIPLPLEVYLLGWRALAEVVLFAAVGMLCYEWIFSTWEKLPFTCSHLPGKTPAWILTLQLLGLLGLLPMVNGLILESLYRPVLYGILLAILVPIWSQVHGGRRDGWGDLHLKYEEEPDPAIHTLNLLR